MSVDEHVNKFVEFLQCIGQEYDTNKKKAKRYTQRLHPYYSSLILAIETHSFHSIIDVVRKMKVGDIIEKNLDLKTTKAV